MVAVIGWDIGGVNIKAVFLITENGCIEKLKTVVEYFPVWKAPQKLAKVLLALKEKVTDNIEVDVVGLTMTAELSDAYSTKRQGVEQVLACAEEAFTDLPIFVADVDSKLRSIDSARAEPLSVAAANWAATGWLVAQFVNTCVVVDVGSTSTSIIPVINRRVFAGGKNDLEKLMIGELVYTGSLRTNVAAIVGSVPIRGGMARVASELFAQSGDVHLVLGKIRQENYTTETADGHGKTRREALTRLARVVCADTEMLSEEEIVQIAQFVYDRQVDQVVNGLSQVYSRVKSIATGNVPVIVTGFGKKSLAETSAKRIGADEVVEFEKLCFGDSITYKVPLKQSERDGVVRASPAFGVALMTASRLDRS